MMDRARLRGGFIDALFVLLRALVAVRWALLF
jgi:hypothetical protein